MARRVALLGIYHESNTFVNHPTILSDFKRYLKGEEIRTEYQDAHHEIGGMFEVLDQMNIEVVPIMYAEATPGGTISSDTYHALLEDMMQEVDKVLPVDAFLVVPHGAGVSESNFDMDGHWLKKLREKVGTDIPIVGTLDLHANVSKLMASSTDALVSYKQNPHIDQRQRGKEAAKLLVRSLNKEVVLTQALVQVPLAISIEQQFTDQEPCKSLYKYADELSRMKGVLSISIQLGFPYADVEEMGTSLLVVSDNNPDLALEVGKLLEAYIIQRKESYFGNLVSVDESVKMLDALEKPVLLLDMGDNIGGGGPGNNSFLLEELEKDRKHKYFVCIYDSNAVKLAKQHKVGDVFDLLMLTTSRDGEINYSVKVELLQFNDGIFKEENPRHGGQTNYKMGDTAIVSTLEGSVIMLTSLRVPPFSLQQLLSFDIDPKQFDALIAKGVNAPIAAYAPVCSSILQVNTPGLTQADMTMFTYKNRRKPLFPFEKLSTN